ncbi:MAG TPA: hypothetical protein PKY59_10170 [Pyrinomonadaceae bacterium]|nr:hypothetical protein [Pyrinomonadaceae bacterium]
MKNNKKRRLFLRFRSNLRCRASELGGECRRISSVGGGTKVFLEVPLNLPKE